MDQINMVCGVCYTPCLELSWLLLPSELSNLYQENGNGKSAGLSLESMGRSPPVEDVEKAGVYHILHVTWFQEILKWGEKGSKTSWAFCEPLAGVPGIFQSSSS